jgi:hypothetical protein
MRNKISIDTRFWAKVDKSGGPLACWNWKATITKHGYGHFRMNGEMVTSNRAAWTLVFGQIPDGLSVLHHCDNPRCVNPAHLFLGTNLDNSRDMVSKGRQHYKLAVCDVCEIRKLANDGLGIRHIARQYDVSATTVSRIVNNKRRKYGIEIMAWEK